MKYEYFVMLLAVLQIGDVLTTEKILKNGRELNPIMNYLFKQFGINKVLIVKAIVVVLLGIMLLELYPIVLIPLCVLYIGVVAWNGYQLRK